MFVSELGLCFSFLVLLSLWFGTQIIMGSQGAEEFTYFFYSLEKGRVMEHGTHEECYAKNGVYRRIFDASGVQAAGG